MNHLQTNQRGYTLIEALIVVALTSIVSVAMAAGINWLYRANAFGIEQSFAIKDARRGAELMIRELREVTTASDGSYALETIDPYSITFFADVTGDARIERVRYYIDNEVLNRGVIEPTGSPYAYNAGDEVVTIAADNVRNEVLGTNMLTYYDSSGTVITDMSDLLSVRFVTVDMNVNINPTRLPNDFIIHSSASLRNLKDTI